MTSLAEQLKAFNDSRKDEFGAAPTPDKPLPLPPTGAGGDVAPPEQEQHYGRTRNIHLGPGPAERGPQG